MGATLAQLTCQFGGFPKYSWRAARRARGQHVGRPKALGQSNADLVRWRHAFDEQVKTIAETPGVSSATLYRVVAED